MHYDIIIAESAVQQFNRLDARRRSFVKEAMRNYLVHAPTTTGKSSIKRLRGLRQPQFRLRVGDVRVFYDVNEDRKRVEVLGFVMKPEAANWLRVYGVYT